jgi:predicted Zn-dependent protease
MMHRALLLLAASAVAISPVSLAAQPARYLNPRDVAEAQRQHAELVQELGGAEAGPRAAYVESVGRRVAAYSGIVNPGQSFRFTTLNSPVENAMSVPGGYVYVTRQLLTIMDNEAELAFALGHETGHIAANHARSREAYTQRQSVLGVLGAILGSVFGGPNNIFSQWAQQRAVLATLSFSREQEYQADSLATRYLIAAGYDPAGGPGILAALARSGVLEARLQGRANRQTPEWASTHPLSESRMQRALADARATGRLGTGLLNRDRFLAALDGVTVDDDPQQGIVEGPVFTHPDLRIQFQVPPGYRMSNGTTAVTISGSAGKAQFSGGRFSGTLENYASRVMQAVLRGQQSMFAPPRRTTINGMPALISSARAYTNSGAFDVSLVAYQWDPQHVYHFIMLTQGGIDVGPFWPMVNSLRRISPAEAVAIRPRIIDVVTVAPGETVQSLAGRMAYRDFKLDRFLALNGLAANSPLVPGQKVKLVIYGARRS